MSESKSLPFLKKKSKSIGMLCSHCASPLTATILSSSNLAENFFPLTNHLISLFRVRKIRERKGEISKFPLSRQTQRHEVQFLFLKMFFFTIRNSYHRHTQRGELKVATHGFSASNKIGEGAFGSVYKGLLTNGSIVAVKMLSIELESMRGEREFVSEITTLTNLKHENLVTLVGCCVEGTKRFLVYNYMENNSLAQVLLGGEQNRIKLRWGARGRILLGVARGLAYLHEEVKPHIVHRDIKASNILLDQNLLPKVSDFGLSRILRDNASHISTHVAGTLGYLAPEYAISGRLTRKTDVYSFGVLLLEIISGQTVVNFDLEHGEHYLVQKAWDLYRANRLLQLVDPVLGMNYPEEDAVRYIKVGLLCVQETARFRPEMSTAQKMLTNEIDIEGVQISQPGLVADLMNIKLGHKTTFRSLYTKASNMESTPSSLSSCS